MLSRSNYRNTESNIYFRIKKGSLKNLKEDSGPFLKDVTLKTDLRMINLFRIDFYEYPVIVLEILKEGIQGSMAIHMDAITFTSGTLEDLLQWKDNFQYEEDFQLVLDKFKKDMEIS